MLRSVFIWCCVVNYFTYPSNVFLDAYARLSACGYVFLCVLVYKCIERNKDRSVFITRLFPVFIIQACKSVHGLTQKVFCQCKMLYIYTIPNICAEKIGCFSGNIYCYGFYMIRYYWITAVRYSVYKSTNWCFLKRNRYFSLNGVSQSNLKNSIQNIDPAITLLR